MLSKADSFEHQNIWNRSKGHSPKNTQTHILGKKVKTKNKNKNS